MQKDEEEVTDGKAGEGRKGIACGEAAMHRPRLRARGKWES